MTSHGTSACYYAGCRRDECRKAKAERVAANRAAARARGFVGLKHGARSAYDAGCKCGPCVRCRAETHRREYQARPATSGLRARCPDCGKFFRLLHNGTIRIHGPAGAECAGSHAHVVEFGEAA